MSNGHAIRYAIYTRQSVARPADFSSCDAQFSKCQRFIDQQKNENLLWVGVHFNDEGESGGTLDRPAMTRLRELDQTCGVDRIHVATLDRLACRAYDMIALLEEFEKAGVLVHLPQELNPPDGARENEARARLSPSRAKGSREFSDSRLKKASRLTSRLASHPRSQHLEAQ